MSLICTVFPKNNFLSNQHFCKIFSIAWARNGYMWLCFLLFCAPGIPLTSLLYQKIPKSVYPSANIPNLRILLFRLPHCHPPTQVLGS